VGSPGCPLRAIDASPRHPNPHQVHFILFIQRKLCFHILYIREAIVIAYAVEIRAILKFEVARVGSTHLQKSSSPVRIARFAANREAKGRFVQCGIVEHALRIPGTQTILPCAGLLRRKAHCPTRGTIGCQVIVIAMNGISIGLIIKCWLGECSLPIIIGKKSVHSDANAWLYALGWIGVVGKGWVYRGSIYIELNIEAIIAGYCSR